eukprot:751712-Hanusia_phi.AAC.3
MRTSGTASSGTSTSATSSSTWRSQTFSGAWTSAKMSPCPRSFARGLTCAGQVCLADDRLFVEIFYNLGMCLMIQSTDNRPRAMEFYRKAIEVCELRIRNMKTVAEGGSLEGSSVSGMSRSKLESEVNELEAIAEDLRQTVESEELQVEGAAAPGQGSSKDVFGGDALKQMGGSKAEGQDAKGFAQVESSEPVKVLGVFGKKRSSQPSAEEGPSKKAALSPQEEPKQPITVEADASAAPTPARGH